MLSWEPMMLNDLAAFYPAYPPLQIAAPSVATTTVAAATTTDAAPVPSATTTPREALLTYIPGFSDKVIANHDVRVYTDAAKRTLLVYGYWDETTLIIARNEAAFTELAGRLARSRTQP